MKRFGSTAADIWIGGLLSFFGGAIVLWLGFLLGQREPWLLVASFFLVLIAGIVALALTWKKYPSLRLGLLIGLALALFNPVSLWVAFLAFVTVAGPPG